MSEALSYLMKVRPGPMETYFSFVKQSTGSLDKKTVAIISLITKVDNQTAKGFKQYLKRALREGVTPNEIIDALLVAFPTLGLSKIIWAMDLLLEMNLSEFSPERLVSTGEWQSLIAVADLTIGQTQFVELDDRGFYVHMMTADNIKVYDQQCPHLATQIPADGLQGNTLTCPKHQWKFDTTSGDCIERGDKSLTQIAHSVEDGQLMILI